MFSENEENFYFLRKRVNFDDCFTDEPVEKNRDVASIFPRMFVQTST